MANDFSADPSCKALWRFENGALTADSKGTNTLTTVNGPTADTSLYKEGDASINLATASHQFFKIADAGLSAGFPLKSGDTLKLITACLWVRPTSLSGWRGLVGKPSYGGVSTAVGLHMNGATLYLKYNGADINTGLTLAINNFYHIALGIDGINKAVTLLVVKDSDGSTQTWSYTPSAQMNIGSTEWRIGAYTDNDANYTFDGKIDEVVVFNRLLEPAETTAIRNGTYPNIVPAVRVADGFAFPLYADQPALRAAGCQAIVLWNDVSPNGHLYVANGIGQAVYENQANLRLSETHALVLWSDQLPGKRKFPLPNPRLRYQTQFGCRKVPVAP